MSINPTADNRESKASRETVTHVQRWTGQLITLRTTRPAGFAFVPGQYARLGLEGADGMIWRAYSLTSAPTEDTLEYYGIIVPGGQFTTLLKDIRVGDAIWVERQVYGFMTADRFTDGDHLWMLSTGTGIGPFISILRDPAVWRRFAHLVLVHGVRHASELGYRDALEALRLSPPGGGVSFTSPPGGGVSFTSPPGGGVSSTSPPGGDVSSASAAQLHLLQAVSREPQDGSPGRLHGRITTLLENGELERAAGLPLTLEHSRIMLCGNPDMIEDTRKLLHARGMRPCRRMKPGHFVTENYW